MAGKFSNVTSKPLCHTLDALTKNQLIELAADLARGELGADACDDAVVAWVAEKMVPVWAFRGDRPLALKTVHMNCVRTFGRVDAATR